MVSAIVSAVGALAVTILIVLVSLFFKTIGIIRTIRPLRGRVSAVVSAACTVGCWRFGRNHLNCLNGPNAPKRMELPAGFSD